METVEQILDILEHYSDSISKVKTNFKKSPKARLTKGYVEARLQCVEDYWTSYRNSYQVLLKLTKKEQRKSLPYFGDNLYSKCEDVYLDLRSDMTDVLESLNQEKSRELAQSASNSSQNDGSYNGEIKLPRINLPTFSGLYEEWQTFEDTFTALIANNKTLSDVQKLHYLKSCLIGEAKNTIKHIQVTAQNYKSAWETLKNRYSHKRLIVNAILKKLFTFKRVNTQSPGQLKVLIDTTKECLNSLQSMDISTSNWDPMIIYMTVQKLDVDTHKEWESHVSREYQANLPTLQNMITFLDNRIHTLELTCCAPLSSTQKINKDRSCFSSSVNITCKLCNGQHLLCHCKDFVNLDAEKKNEFVKSNRLCFNCLSPGHPVYHCKQKTSCKICGRRHHSLLHNHKRGEDFQDNEKIKDTPGISSMHTQSEQQEASTDESIIVNFAHKQTRALLATALVSVKSDCGRETTLRALIDPGSQASFISENATQLIRLKKTPVQCSITGIGCTTTPVRYVVQLEISSRYDKEFSLPLKAYVLQSHLTSKLPSSTIKPNSDWSHLVGLTLADPQYFMSKKVDMLLGIDVYTEIVKNNLVKGPPGSPSAQETSLGWILFGSISEGQLSISDITVMHQKVEIDMDNLLKNLWSIDDTSKRTLTFDERTCEEIYKNTTTRDLDGRYVVKLPFKIPPQEIGSTRDIALRRLEQLERRLENKPDLKKEYCKVMEEYIHLNHMEEVPDGEKNKLSIYLPHHAVVRDNSETTKVRIVFDASCKSSRNNSLNDLLLVGPQLQEDLRNLIMRFRMKKICFVTDIAQMYRMILVTKEDTDFQRVLWRQDPSQQIKEYRMLRVTFGIASAPYLAIKTLKQLSIDEGDKYPIGAKILAEDYYVDDCISGCDSVEEAIEASRQLSNLLKSGGFILQKWASNSKEFIQEIPQHLRSLNVDTNESFIKTLGLIWNMKSDTFHYQINLPSKPLLTTKRNILGDIQRLFDPLGWIAPAIIPAKILIQNLWKEKLSWDEEVKKSHEEEWKKIRDSFKQIHKIQVKRWINTESERENISLHGYCDASIKAYCAVIYYRIEKENREVQTGIIASRTKVAPVKTISLPRLELCGAVLLSKLLAQVREAMRLPETKCYAWTDSTVVLSWLSGDPNRWKQFVSNRVVEILDKVPHSQWFHVRSKDNPADLGSRGVYVDNLINNRLWWEGPDSLKEKDMLFSEVKVTPTDIEMKRISVNFKTLKMKFEDFTTLQELLRAITYSLRFLRYKKQPENVNKPLTTIEIEEALIKSIKIAQSEEFESELESLQKGKNVRKESCLKLLNPYLDENNILRVGGRLRNADLCNDKKYPIILGTRNRLSHLIVAEAHQKTLHGGIQLMLGYIKSKYWIVRVKHIIKTHIHKCIVCARHRAISRTQLMGNLPKVRITPARPFFNSGVDFAGPLQVLMSKGRGAKTRKAYIAIFVCMATKAIHLELVGDLTAEAFIGAFNRFVARRGRCAHIWSDHGRNFVGANKDLQTAFKEANLNLPDDTADILAADGTQWHFIPPYSPNFGGLWEAAVKSTKFHLKRILNTHLTFEELTTILCQVEACLNSRPLIPVDTTDTEIDVLTPGHFLIGEAPVIIPCPNLSDANVHHLTRWQLCQRLVANFWSRWQNEYLSRLQTRPKWLKKQKEYEIGDIVLVKDEQLPPGKWALGRIVAKHPGEDNLTRVYSIKYRNNIIQRSISKICALPLDKD